MLYTGFRAAEAAALCLGDVDLDEGVIVIGLSKGNHGRVVPIHPDLKKVLVAWIAAANLTANAPLFPRLDSASDDTPMTPARVGKIVRLVRLATGLPLTAHTLRHTFATWVLRKSKDLYAVSKALGHKQLKQTEIYVSAEVEQIAEAVATLPGRADW
jgi:integrase